MLSKTVLTMKYLNYVGPYPNPILADQLIMPAIPHHRFSDLNSDSSLQFVEIESKLQKIRSYPEFPEGREYHLLQVSWQTQSQPTKKVILSIIKRNFFSLFCQLRYNNW